MAGVRGRADAAQAGATESDARGGKREPAESGDLLARIYEQHREDVYRFLFRRMRDAEDAADLTQDVFAEAAAKMPTVRDDRPALPWLYAVARRRLVDEWRSANRRRPGPQRIAGGEPVAPERVVGFAEALVAAFRTLPPSQREVVRMRLFENRPYAEISHCLLTREDACRARFERALRSLRERLRSAGYSPLLIAGDHAHAHLSAALYHLDVVLRHV